MRVRGDTLPADPAAAKATLEAMAYDCERLCRLLEAQPTPALLADALRAKAITAEQAAALGANLPAPVQEGPGPLTILAAAVAHPSTPRESLKDQQVHHKAVEDFAALTGVRHLADLRLEHVQQYLAVLQQQGLSWDTRRHRLLWLRRACRYGVSQGLPDILAGFRLDRNMARPVVEVWTLDELAAACLALSPKRVAAFPSRWGAGGADPIPNHRPRAAVALGGFLGLRPSECRRLLVGAVDLDQAVLRIEGEVKNGASRRTLPMPPVILPWLRPLVEGRPPTQALLPARSSGTPYRSEQFGRWLNGEMTNVGVRQLTAKCLRKSFASWSIRVLALRHVEAYLGHQAALVAAVTARHYLQQIQLDELRPAALQLDASIRSALATCTPPALATA